jgi:hypothetical protein
VRHVSPQAEFTPPVIYSIGSRSKLVFMVEAVPDGGRGAQARAAGGRAPARGQANARAHDGKKPWPSTCAA